MCTPKIGATYDFHCCVVDKVGCVARSGSPEVHDNLLCLVNVQDQAVHPTPVP